MSDEMIKGILLERKRAEKKKAAIKRMTADCIGAAALFVGMPFMLALYGWMFI